MPLPTWTRHPHHIRHTVARFVIEKSQVVRVTIKFCCLCGGLLANNRRPRLETWHILTHFDPGPAAGDPAPTAWPAFLASQSSLHCEMNFWGLWSCAFLAFVTIAALVSLVYLLLALYYLFFHEEKLEETVSLLEAAKASAALTSTPVFGERAWFFMIGFALIAVGCRAMWQNLIRLIMQLRWKSPGSDEECLFRFVELTADIESCIFSRRKALINHCS